MKKNITTFGEILWDIFPDKEILGGAPLNFAYFSAKRGMEASIISAVGCDKLGKSAIETALSHNINCDAVSFDDLHNTGVVNVELASNGSAKYAFPDNSAWDYIPLLDVALEKAKDSHAFVFGTLAQRSTTSQNTLRHLLNQIPQDCTVIFDINLRQNFYTKSIVEYSLNSADILKINDDELVCLKEMLRLEGAENSLCETVLSKYKLKYLILTLGARGYKIFSDTEYLEDKPIAVEIADTVGAGDAFTATFVSDILNGIPAREAANNANEIASLVCSRRGAFCL